MGARLSTSPPAAATGTGPGPPRQRAQVPSAVSNATAGRSSCRLSVGQHEGNDHQLLPFGAGGYALASAWCITSTGSYPWDAWT
jgi:hypothetical protein